MSGSESYPPPGATGDDPPPPGSPGGPALPGGSYPPPPGWQDPAPPPPPPPGYPPYQPTQTYPHPGRLPGPGQLAGQQLWNQPPGQQGWAPGGVPQGMLAATHKPGAIALRPLQLGDIYDAAFRIIRFNPRATVGAAVLVSSIAMLLPVLVTAILTRTEDMTIDSTGGLTGSDVAPILGSVGSSLLGFLLQSLGLVLVTGMVAHVTMAAAIGRKLTFAEAFAATKGKRGKLFGLVALLLLMTVLLVALLVVAVIAVVVGIGGLAGALLIVLLIPVFSLALFWFWIRIYYLPVPALMLEEVGVFGAIERAHALTARAFWRVFGIALLTWFITSVAGGLLGLPLTAAVQSLLGAGLDGQYAALAVTVVNALVSVVQAAFVAPFTAAVTSLQYIDQRIRKEAFDVELMTRAGIMAS